MPVNGLLGARLLTIYTVGRKSGFRKPLTQLNEEWKKFPLVIPAPIQSFWRQKKVETIEPCFIWPRLLIWFEQVIDLAGTLHIIGWIRPYSRRFKLSFKHQSRNFSCIRHLLTQFSITMFPQYFCSQLWLLEVVWDGTLLAANKSKSTD